MILHDQEPFDISTLDTYKSHMIHAEKRVWRIDQPLEEVLLSVTMHLGWQILCHSEDSSRDMDFVRQAGSIPCYYWYHGLIARDWFRHWKHHGAISCHKNWHNRFLLYARDHTGSRQYRKRLVQDLASMPWSVQHDPLSSNIIPPDASATISVIDAQTAAIHLVAETVFDQHKIHLTEKIFKPMVMLQPFIVFAGAGSLQYLKRYGFQTFDCVWDETYDLESDHQLRYQKILALISQLSAKSQAEISVILEKCRPVLEHNHRLFFSEEFEKKLLDELRANMAHSLGCQQEKIEVQPGGIMLHVWERLRSQDRTIPEHWWHEFLQAMHWLNCNESSRYHAILQRHPWLTDCLV
jgi:hypothetical protein